MMAEPIPFTLDTNFVLCLAFVLSFMPVAYGLGVSLLPAKPLRNRVLFIWHAYDALTHFFVEGGFLYECFYSYVPVPSGLLQGPYFLGYQDRLHGPAHGSGPSARLWQEYAKADRRWAVSDPNIVSLELLSVLLLGPAAVSVCYLLYRSSSPRVGAHARAVARSRLWFVASAIAFAELYGGWMTFAPEWLTGSSQLDTSEPVYLWLYLVFFNSLWVMFPVWVLWEAAHEFRAAFIAAEVYTVKKRT
jgi:hypothetical protein